MGLNVKHKTTKLLEKKKKKKENFKDVEQRIFRLNTKNTSYKREN